MLPVTPDHLESIAFSTGATIELHRSRAFLTHAGITYATPLPTPACDDGAESAAEVGGL